VPQSLANILIHLVFSTKDREPFLTQEDLRGRTHAYLAEVLRSYECPTLIVGGVADHVHALFRLSRTQSVASLLEHLKTSSSKWIKAQGVAGFGWQRGYGGFSVSESNAAAVVAYIEKQKEHHLKMTFEDEFRLILQRHRVQFDERYVWD
jgi:REP element-mobilizing transposase RayT